jgi:L-threonylcarbamoyladenylate synthase
MKIVTGNWSDQQVQRQALEALLEGNPVIGTSDTVLGLYATLTSKGYAALNAVKQRENKPYLILIDSLDRVSDFVMLPLKPYVKKLIKRVWPGSVTLILKARSDIPSFLSSKDGTIALRLPDNKGLCEVVRVCGGLFSTSANVAGGPVPVRVVEIDDALQQQVSLCVVEPGAENQQALPSTIIDCTGDTPRVVRQGAVVIDGGS